MVTPNESAPKNYTRVDVAAGIGGAAISAGAVIVLGLEQNITQNVQSSINHQNTSIYQEVIHPGQPQASIVQETHYPVLTGTEIGVAAGIGIAGFVIFGGLSKIIRHLKYNWAEDYAARKDAIGPHKPTFPPTKS